MLAVVLIVLGIYFNDRYNFAHTNVREQLGQQKIFFPEKSALTVEELKQPGLVKYAGQQLLDGDQAQVYANEFIGEHLRETAGGKTYAERGGPLFALQDKVDAAKESNAPNLASLEADLDAARAERTTVLTGETLRGLLLTTYGFWHFGDEAQLAMWVCFHRGGPADPHGARWFHPRLPDTSRRNRLIINAPPTTAASPTGNPRSIRGAQPSYQCWRASSAKPWSPSNVSVRPSSVRTVPAKVPNTWWVSLPRVSSPTLVCLS